MTPRDRAELQRLHRDLWEKGARRATFAEFKSVRYLARESVERSGQPMRRKASAPRGPSSFAWQFDRLLGPTKPRPGSFEWHLDQAHTKSLQQSIESALRAAFAAAAAR
jgi:hypothetical protein